MDEPKVIGLLTPAFVGVTGFDSGIGAHFRHLADALAAAGKSVTAVVVTDKPASVPELPYDVRTVTVRKSALARSAGRFSWQLHQWLNLRAAMSAAAHAARAVEVDIWETTSTGSLALFFLTGSRRAPVVVRVSTTSTQLRETNAGATRWITRCIENWEDATVHRADRVLTHSVLHRDTIARQFGLSARLIPIIPHGIPVPPPIDRPPRPDRCAVLFVGRFEYRKGIDLLFAALPEFLAAAPHAAVTLVGADQNSHWQTYWHDYAPAVVRDRVHFAGVVDAAALDAHYRVADLFVAPSRYESFGLVFVEAMGHALPVVALRAPGAADLIEHDVTGVLASTEDPHALAAALIALAGDPARRAQIGAAARRIVEQRYSLRALSEASISFYREALMSMRSSHP